MTKQKVYYEIEPAPGVSRSLLSSWSFIVTSTFVIFAVLHGYGYSNINNHEKEQTISPNLSSPGGVEINKRNLQGDSASSYEPKPKMNAKPITPVEEDNSPFSKENDGSFVENLKSKVAYFTGACSSQEPFQFSIGGTSGSGVIGTPPPVEGTRKPETFVTSISFFEYEGGNIALMMDKVDANFFPFSPSSNFVGVPFSYDKVSSEALTSVIVSCSNYDPIDIVVIVGDDEHGVVNAKATHALGSDRVHVELVGSLRSNDTLRVDPILPIVQQKESEGGKRHLRAIQEVEGVSSVDEIYLQKELKIAHETSLDSYDGDDIGCALVQFIVLDSQGKKVPKTIVVCSELHDGRRSRKLQDAVYAIQLDSAHIDKNGDVALKFASLDYNNKLEDSVIKLDARIGILSECNKEAIAVVHMNAMLSSTEPTLVINGGWFRRATKIHNIYCDWEPVLLDAVATDPNSRYTFLGRLDNPTSINVINNNKSGNNRRHLLKASPSPDELEINEEMKVGRKPQAFTSSTSNRDLEGETHKKIIVHGYCSGPGNSFNMKHFKDAIEFSDPDALEEPEPGSWSVDEFARKIDKFAVYNDIDGCGIIAHSQGGMAALHLKDKYWSCLDNAVGGGKRKRLIQSVGTPYQGSPLAGNIAAIGSIFGLLCGYNYDLTTDGAIAWLDEISNSARSNVFYGRTYAETGPFTTPCLWTSDLILDDPEDGVVESENAVLPGGRPLFHQEGLCHISANFPAQTSKRSINRKLNKRAMY